MESSTSSESNQLNPAAPRRSYCGCSGGWPFPLLSPGDVHGLFVDRVSKLKETAKGDYSEAMRSGLVALGATGQINRADGEFLSKLTDIIVGISDIGERISAVRALNVELLSSGDSSPVARAIFSIAINSLVAQVSHPPPPAPIRDIVAADVAGAYIGASIGGVIGAVVFAVAFSVLAAVS
jgi:hypothetical protein